VGDTANWYRINELEKLSGVSRRNVHFYLEQGLLPPPQRTGRTMAYYNATHVAALKYIRAARARHTPLFAIKAQLAARFGRTGVRVPARHTSPQAARPPARRGRPPGRQDMRARILDVGCRLFLGKGFRDTAVSDITAQLKVGKGTFYFYFSDKDELFLECAPRMFQELFAASWNKIRREHDPLRRLELRAEAVLPVLNQLCAILALSREALQSPRPKIRAMGQQALVSICRPLEEDLSTAMVRGLVRSLDPKATSVMLTGVMESLQYLQAAGAKLTPREMRNAVSALILSGIRSG
jgi:AcrR family transcriptional regulator